MKRVEVFVAATGNAFMADIAGWLVEAARLAGRDARLVTNGLPADPLVTNLVVAPHELFLLNGGDDAELNSAAAVSIPICTEQPGTPWFDVALGLCRLSAAVFDINDNGVAGLRRAGVAADRLLLGGVPSMVADPVDRDLDVLFLGGDTDHRRAALAALGSVLWDRRSQLRLFRFAEPVHAGVPGLIFGADKYALLARSRVLVNIHRDGQAGGYFEWARVVEAMANGTTVVSEPSTGYHPLRPGVHFVETDDLAGTVAELLDDVAGCAAIGAAGAVAVLDEYPLSQHLAPVLDRLDSLDLTRRSRRQRRVVRRNKPMRAPDPPLFPVFRPVRQLRRRVFHALFAEQDLQRTIDAVRCEHTHGVASNDVEFTTQTFDNGDEPDVSVVVTLFNYAGVIGEALDSIVASTGISSEIIVVDDHSTDDGRAVVQRFMDEHQDVPILLLGREANGGLPRARNLGVSRASAAKVMILDADNSLYPTCLWRLAGALDENADASFAYATLEAFGDEPGLRSHLGWYLPWLCAANYLDAQAMIRREVLQRHGGYRTDDEWIYGVEDWDLWLRLAAAGEHGVHVPEMLGRYRTQRTSMISMSNLAAEEIHARLTARYPALPWPADPDPQSGEDPCHSTIWGRFVSAPDTNLPHKTV
ncbi:MAG TPA: glycosyltransferase family A protein [Desertimonas sp.]|nr:glycosyltransferase family A protein [Desertimonas sp.]